MAMEVFTPSQLKIIDTNPLIQELINRFELEIIPSPQVIINSAIHQIVEEQFNKLKNQHEK